jgi:hypothetical protein
MIKHGRCSSIESANLGLLELPQKDQDPKQWRYPWLGFLQRTVHLPEPHSDGDKVI